MVHIVLVTETSVYGIFIKELLHVHLCTKPQTGEISDSAQM